MSYEARIHSDVVFHERDGAAFTVGSLSDHRFSAPNNAMIISGVAGTSAADISGSGDLSTLAIKNTGLGTIRIADAFDVTSGRMAVLPTTATVSIQAVGQTCAYTAIWVG